MRVLGAGRKMRIVLLCNWCSSRELAETWRKMLPRGLGVELADAAEEAEPDLWVVVNGAPAGARYDPARTILLQMEPNLPVDEARERAFMAFLRTGRDWNTVEWHLSMTYDALLVHEPRKPRPLARAVTAVLSGKCTDPGHRLRHDLARMAQARGQPFTVWGARGPDDQSYAHADYRGRLPYHAKDDALFPYRYHLAVENHAIPYYATEKLYDALLAECLPFYWGAPNAHERVDPEAFIVLPLELDPEGGRATPASLLAALARIRRAVREDEWTRRLPAIRRAKRALLRRHSCFVRVAALARGARG